MKLSPLQLEGYALTELSYRANQAHKPDAKTTYSSSALQVNVECRRTTEKEPTWELAMSVRLQPSEDANAPYYISFQLSGRIRFWDDNVTADRVESIVRMNGSNVLYGVAREVTRQVTSIGPFPPLLLPSLDFRPDQEDKIQTKKSAQNQPELSPP
jgi:preprotein translocase subunit SecB